MTQETKHTLGPWARFDTPDYAEIHPASGEAKSPIALVGRAGDADLIAAAPDLLASLREIRDMFMARPDMVKAIQPLIGFGEKAAFERAAAALQKAGG
jgi:hypothetical protein